MPLIPRSFRMIRSPRTIARDRFAPQSLPCYMAPNGAALTCVRLVFVRGECGARMVLAGFDRGPAFGRRGPISSMGRALVGG